MEIRVELLSDTIMAICCLNHVTVKFDKQIVNATRNFVVKSIIVPNKNTLSRINECPIALHLRFRYNRLNIRPKMGGDRLLIIIKICRFV